MTKAFPKISIITPSFNQGKFIKETIDSVLSQNYPNLEYIIVDGGSTDDTVKILKSYGKKVKWISEKDKGQADAINKGLKRINGEIIAFINSDDYYLPGTFNKVVKFFQNNPSRKMVSGDYDIVNEFGKPIQSFVRLYKSFFKNFESLTILSILNYINQPSTFWKREIYKKIGFFDEELIYTMDYDYWMRTLKSGFKIGFINEKLSAFRIHTGSKGGSRFEKQFKEEIKVQIKHNDKSLLNLLHIIHNTMIIKSYNLIK